MKSYNLTINTVDNLYKNYIVVAPNLFSAKAKCKKVFFKEFPDADKNIRVSLTTVDTEILTEIMEIIRRNGD